MYLQGIWSPFRFSAQFGANILGLAGDGEQLLCAPWSEITSAAVTLSETLLSHPSPSSPCVFYGLLLACSHSCGTARAGSAVMRHLSVFLLTCLQFIRAEVGGWLN